MLCGADAAQAIYDGPKTSEGSEVGHIGSVERACYLLPGVGCPLIAVIRISGQAATTKFTVIQVVIYLTLPSASCLLGSANQRYDTEMSCGTRESCGCPSSSRRAIL